MTPNRNRYTKEQMIEALQYAYKEIGDGGKLADFFRHNQPSRNAIKLKFGTWNAALELAGIPVTKRQSIPKDEVIVDVKRVAELIGKSPTLVEYDKHGKFSIPTIQKIGYGKILKQLGLKQHRKVPKEQIIQELKEVAQELGYTPSVDEFIAHPKGSNNWQVYKHFKSYKELLKEANLTTLRRFTTQDGHIVGSSFEMEVDNFLFQNNIPHEVQVQVCNRRKWMCDFVVGTLWIEVDGMGKKRPKIPTIKFQEKLKFYQDNSFNYFILLRNDEWPNILLETIHHSLHYINGSDSLRKL